MSVDMDRAKLLLDVVHSSATAGPSTSNILALANFELMDMEAAALKDVTDIKAKAAKKAADEAKAKEEERVKAQKEAEAKLSATPAASGVTYTSDSPERKV